MDQRRLGSPNRVGTVVCGRIAGAKFIGFDEGGHIWVGHDDEVRAAIVELRLASTRL